MECPKRCPNKTRCNKKTNICQTSTKKVGTPVTRLTRCYAGTKRNKKTGDCENDFIQLCKKHILVPTLDKVLATSWVTNKDCNIFMIGEKHARYTKCTSILEMFKTLMDENAARSRPIQIDLMIEYLHKDLFHDDFPIVNTDAQLNFVRNYFDKCIKKHTCPARVHWTDPTQIDPDHHRTIPKWLSLISESKWYDDAWTQNKKITDFFNNESDVPKILTENVFVVKEIEKAAKVNPKFTLAFATKLFMDYFKELRTTYKTSTWQKLVKSQSRHVMDFYVAARIIKSKMKNVIFYAGALHTERLIHILTSLNFKLIRTIDGTCMT
jgi:hypothetical protein